MYRKDTLRCTLGRREADT
ncbi:hypothetical protein LINPERPRIM_LOCUS2779 [Linum perenne]